MDICEETARYIRSLLISAALLFSGAPAAIGLAIVLNDGFLSAPLAPAPMLVAAGAAMAASVDLRYVLPALDEWADPRQFGCVPRTCFGSLGLFRNALLAAIGILIALSAACASVALNAWIPWVPQAQMWAIFTAAAAAAASLAYLLVLFGRLRDCGARTASAVGALQAGEKASDPWFLRLKPEIGADYSRPMDSTPVGAEGISNQWLECAVFDVRWWEVRATAYLIGNPSGPVTFTWSFGGTGIPATTVQTGPPRSTVAVQSASSPSPKALSVTASDPSGFKRTVQVEISLSDKMMKCHLVLHFVPEDLLRIEPPGPVEIASSLTKILEVHRALGSTKESNPAVDVPHG